MILAGVGSGLALAAVFFTIGWFSNNSDGDDDDGAGDSVSSQQVRLVEHRNLYGDMHALRREPSTYTKKNPSDMQVSKAATLDFLTEDRFSTFDVQVDLEALNATRIGTHLHKLAGVPHLAGKAR